MISLRSCQEGVHPLDIHLDDAELADLVRCLDDLRLDPRVKVSWDFPTDRPLSRSQVSSKIRYSQRFSYFLIGASSFMLISALWLKIPVPKGIERPSAEFSPARELVDSDQN